MATDSKTPDLFTAPQVDAGSTVFLIDCSGSVLGKYTSEKKVFDRIYDQVLQIAEKDNLKNFRVIFWHSDEKSTSNFTNGIFSLPFLVSPASFKTPFEMVRSQIDRWCLTMPWLAFDKIPDGWIDKTGFTNVYLVTDGQIGWGSISSYDKSQCKSKLASSLNRVLKNKGVRIHIVTIEGTDRDFSKMETLTSAAGCDVFDTVKANNLTNKVASFTSYTPNKEDGFVHYTNVLCPPGYHPFQNKVFHNSKTNEFMQYVRDLIPTLDHDDLCLLVNDLSKTLASLTADKPSHVREMITNMICNFFEGSELDKVMVSFILKDAIQKVTAGQAEVVTECRHNVKKLFKQADEFLKKDVRDATNASSQNVMSLPLAFGETYKIVLAPSNLMNDPFRSSSGKFPNSSVVLNDRLIPMMAMSTNHTVLSDQCTRQWVRELLAAQYGIGKMGDICFYLFMGKTLQVVLSDIPEEVKNAYIKTCKVMLGKRRLNKNITEFENLVEGYPPLPNSGVAAEFMGDMQKVNEKLGTGFKPYTLWYAMCLALRDSSLTDAQLRHCVADIKTDFPDIEPSSLLTAVKDSVKTVEVVHVPHTYSLDYTCLITAESTAETGGKCIKAHDALGGTCHPKVVFSSGGYAAFKDSGHFMCPICYTGLDEDSFEDVGPKIALDDLIPAGEIRGVYSPSGVAAVKKSSYKPSAVAATPPPPPAATGAGSKRYVVIMKGTVGAGKSTVSQEIKQQVEAAGGQCLSVGPDKYCKDGYSMPAAISKVSSDIAAFASKPDELLVLVVDTCGERATNMSSVFGVNLSGWTKLDFYVSIYGKKPNHMNASDMQDYMSWSLTNVLNRSPCTPDCNYWLNPHGAGVGVCVSVNMKKAQSLFGKKKCKSLFPGGAPGSIEDAKSAISTGTARYQTYLEGFSVAKEVAKLLQGNGVTN